MKKRKKGKAVLLAGLGTAAATAAAMWVSGSRGPIRRETPYVITLNRPELRAFRDDLLRGNEWGYLCSPQSASRGLGCTGDDCACGLQALSDEVKAGNTVYYHAYSQEERTKDPALNTVGIYVLRSHCAQKKPYAAMIAGGGFKVVCTLWESLPVCADFQKMGYTGFCLTHRTGIIGESITHEMIAQDIAACISFITDHAEEFNIEREDYLIGGFSAGGWAATAWANESTGYRRFGLPAPSAAALIYGVNADRLDSYRIPTFSRFCTADADQADFTSLRDRLTDQGVPADFREVDAKHGFGLGSGSEAEGWTKEAEAFWRARRGEK